MNYKLKYWPCKTCGSIFRVKPSRVFAGKGVYCSRECFHHRVHNPEDRFWKNVDKTDNCWFWRGHIARNGYGRMSIGRRGEAKNYGAHRFSYELKHGKLPEKQGVFHRCDVRHCVNPDHLFTGTQQDNVTDCVKKGRQARGEGIGTSILTQDQVSEIKRRFSFGTNMVVSMSKEFGVSDQTIRRIRDEVCWKHIQNYHNSKNLQSS